MNLHPRIRTKIHQACFIVITIAVAILVITSCASRPQPAQRALPPHPTPDRIGGQPPVPLAPTPFTLGEEVQPPYGCLDLRNRGGEC